MPALQETFNHLDALLSSLTGISFLYVSFGDKKGANPQYGHSGPLHFSSSGRTKNTKGSGCNQNERRTSPSRWQRFYEQVEGNKRSGKACDGQDQRWYGREVYTIVRQHLFHAK